MIGVRLAILMKRSFEIRPTKGFSLRRIAHILMLIFALAGCNGPIDPAGGVATITVTPSPASVEVDKTFQFTAQAKASSGNGLTGVTFTWSSSNPAVATVDASGLVKGVGLGEATITATAEGKIGSATLTVVAGSIQPPSAPTGIAKTVGDGQVTLTWNANPAGERVTSYTLYMTSERGVTKTSYLSLPDGMKHEGVTSPFTHTSLTNGKTYFFVVTATNARGEGAESIEIAATPVDLIAPTVVSTNPANNDTSATTTTVTATFSEAMDPATINTSTFTLKAGTREVAGAVSGSGNTATFRTSLSPATHHTATITTGAKDRAGNPIAANHSWGFITSASLNLAVRGNGSVTSSPAGISCPMTCSAFFAFGASVTLTESPGEGSSFNGWDGACSGISTTCIVGMDTNKVVVANFVGFKVTRLVSELMSIGELAVDDTFVYFVWALAGDGRVAKVPLSGGTVTTLVSGLRALTVVAIDDTHVYFTDCGTDTCTGGIEPNWPSIKKVSKDGGEVTILAGGLSHPNDLSVDSTHVYFTESSPATVKKVSKAGGAITTLATGGSAAFGGIAIDDTDVYWMESGAGRGNVLKVSKNGGAVTNLANLIFITRNRIAVDTSFVYFTETGSIGAGAVKKVPKTGGTVVTLASNLNDPGAIVADSTTVYFLECGSLTPCSGGVPTGALKKVSKDGGLVTTLFTTAIGQSPGTIGLDVDNTAVYFADPGKGGLTGTINKVSK